jgi:hypothetical protein
MAYKSRKSSRKYRSTKKCSRGRKGVRSHKRKSGKSVKAYCRRSYKKSKRRSYKKSKRQTSRCGPGKRYVKSFRRSDGSTTGGFCASLTRRRRSSKKSNKSYKPRKYNKSRKQKSRGSLLSGMYKPRKSMTQSRLYEPSLFSQTESRSPTPFRNPFVQRSPAPVKASSFRPQELPKEEELGMDFKPLTERMRYRTSPKQGIFGSLKAGLAKGKEFAAKAQTQVSKAIEKGQELTKKAEQLQKQAAEKAEQFQKAAEKIQAQAEQVHSQYQEAKKELTDIVGSTGLPVVSPAETAKETAQQVASTVQPAMRMKRRY